MSDYALSVLAKGQAVVTQKNQAPEQRRKIPTVMELALKNGQFSIPNAQELRVSPLRTVEIDYFTNVAPGATTTKAYNHTGAYGDSNKVTVTYVTHVELMHLPRKLAYNNLLSYQAMFNNLYEMKWKNLRKRHDDSALSYLFANRCQLSAATINAATASTGLNSWSDANLALEIEATKKTRFIQWVKAFMAARFFTGELDIITDLQLGAEFDYQSQQGQGNAANTQFQFAGVNINVTQDAVDAAYPGGAVLALPAGLFSGLVWNEGLNVKGVNEGNNNVGSLGTVADPFGGGAIADLSMYTVRADTSANATGGSTQDIMDEWEISLTVGYVIPPLSTANDSVVHAIGQLS